MDHSHLVFKLDSRKHSAKFSFALEELVEMIRRMKDKCFIILTDILKIGRASCRERV